MTWNKNSQLLHIYRPDIDGLRGIAVLAVVIFHAFPNYLRGGFIGVDIFFVISGFLITKIILQDLLGGNFRFSNFYIHRIRRIFPALLLVLLFSILFGWVALLSDEYKLLAKHILAASTFTSNFIYWGEVGYFDLSADKKPLLHLWSLGIEEQFYIVWPVILWIFWKKKVNLLLPSIIIFIISFAFNIVWLKIDSAFAFYSPLTRVWELMAGCMLACSQFYFELIKNLRSEFFKKLVFFKIKLCSLTDLFSLIGIFLLAFGFYRINQQSEFPGWWALIPVIGAVMILASGSGSIVNRYIFSSRLFVSIGLISYPLYLWHWPLFVFANLIEGGQANNDVRLVLIFLSLILAWATYKFIEIPIRFKYKSQNLIILLLINSAIIISVIGATIFYNEGIPSRVEKYESISNAAGEWGYPGRLSSFEYKGRIFRHQPSNNTEVTVFLGDSNIEQYYPRVDELILSMPDKVNSAVFVAGGGCLPIPFSPYGKDHKNCINLMETAFNYSIENTNVKNVVIGAQWNGYLSDGFGLNGTFGYGTKEYNQALQRLSLYIKQIKDKGKKVYIILNIPTGIELDPKYLIVRGIYNFPSFFKIRSGGVDRNSINESYENIQADLARLGEESGAIVISPMDYLCNKRSCPSVDEAGMPIYKDNTHLRPTYVRNNIFFIDKTLVKDF